MSAELAHVAQDTGHQSRFRRGGNSASSPLFDIILLLHRRLFEDAGGWIHRLQVRVLGHLVLA
jgi:hypothetical protein